MNSYRVWFPMYSSPNLEFIVEAKSETDALDVALAKLNLSQQRDRLGSCTKKVS